MTDRAVADRWADALERWALPDVLVASVQDDPWRLDASRFADRARGAAGRRTPADDAALAALPRRGSVLDVGCGGGAASVPLASSAATCTGVDALPPMLEAYVQQVGRARRLLRPGHATAASGVLGRWPDVAPEVPDADVVVCHDVLYNVADVVPFVAALSARARRRVVVALPERHPLTWLTPYFEQLHGIGRPSRPTAGMFVDVLRSMGESPQVAAWDEHVERAPEEVVATVARRLCVGPDRHDEVAEALWRTPPPTVRAMVAVHWDPATRT